MCPRRHGPRPPMEPHRLSNKRGAVDLVFTTSWKGIVEVE